MTPTQDPNPVVRIKSGAFTTIHFSYSDFDDFLTIIHQTQLLVNEK